MDSIPLRERILETIVSKSTLKQRVFDNTFAAFNDLKETLLETASEMDDELDGKLDRRVRIEYRDRGKHEAQLQVASDLLIFQMHTDVFNFAPDHSVLKTPYVKSDSKSSYCGVIYIYNFLSESFKLSRNADEGYLIGRIFINHENQFFVEGEIEGSLRAESFGSKQITEDDLVEIIEHAIDYALNFDPYIPEYEYHTRVVVDQFNSKMDNSKFENGKRLGRNLNFDNIK